MKVGQTVSHYKILAKLGEGGMGVVYKAEDTKLGRHVVLKFLAPYLTRDQQVIERFINEAKTASALDHPNICTIYEIGESNDGQLFIAMAYYEGETLREKVASGPLSVDRVIHIAMQIASGLARAHEAGIIHRDVKPANVMITKREEVKILDFGLAKLAGQQHLTKSGATMGTIAYMSPEQTQGLLVDHRTDIWSLGVVMYEMFTGQLPFKGEYDQAMMYSIVNKDAEPLTSLRSNVPMDLEHVVAKMLAKDPALRYQHVDELPADLRAIEKGSFGKWSLSSRPVTMALAGPSKRASHAWRVAALMALVAAMALGWLFIRSSSTERLISRSYILPPENTTFNADHGRHIAISPDGRRFAFVATDFAGVSSLWVRSLSALTATPLSGTEGTSFPFWSSDGRTLGFFSGGKLKKIDAAGGLVLTICDAPNGRGGSWNKDGVILFAPNEYAALFKVAASGGAPIQVTTLNSARGEAFHRWPSFLPDGKRFVFSAHSVFSTGMADTIKLGFLERPTSLALLPAEMNAVYASGHLIFLQEGTLMARPFDPARLQFTAEATPIAENIQYRRQSIGKANFSVSQNGVMILQTGNENFDRFALFDRMGNRLAVFPEQAVFGARFSPDDKLIAFPRLDGHSRYDVWVRDLSRGTVSRLTFDPAIDYRPVWSPDGRFIVFCSNRKGQMDLFMKNINDAVEEQLLLESGFTKFPSSWSRDGKYLAFTLQTKTKTGMDLCLLPLFGKRQPVAVLQTEFDEAFARISPDGRWLVYESNETGRPEIYIRALDGSGWKWQVSTGGGQVPIWPGEGKEIFFSPSDSKVMVAEVKFTAGKVITGAARALFDLESSGITLRCVEDVSSDGKTILARINGAPQTMPLTLVINWDAEAKK